MKNQKLINRYLNEIISMTNELNNSDDTFIVSLYTILKKHFEKKENCGKSVLENQDYQKSLSKIEKTLETFNESDYKFIRQIEIMVNRYNENYKCQPVSKKNKVREDDIYQNCNIIFRGRKCSTATSDWFTKSNHASCEKSR